MDDSHLPFSSLYAGNRANANFPPPRHHPFQLFPPQASGQILQIPPQHGWGSANPVYGTAPGQPTHNVLPTAYLGISGHITVPTAISVPFTPHPPPFYSHVPPPFNPCVPPPNINSMLTQNSEVRTQNNQSEPVGNSADSSNSRRRRSRSRESRQRSQSRIRRSRSHDRRRRSRSRERRRSRSQGRRSRSLERRRRSRSRGRRRRSRSSSRHSRLTSVKQERRSASTSRSSNRRNSSFSCQSRRSRSPNRKVGSDEARRNQLIENWRRLNCKTDEEFERRLEAISKMNAEEVVQDQLGYWIRSAPADTYYEKDPLQPNVLRATSKSTFLREEFENTTIKKAKKVREQTAHMLPPKPVIRPVHRCKHNHKSCSSSSSEEDDIDDDVGSEERYIMEELQRKLKHPFRLHRELWHNEPGQMNDGPLCRCSKKAQRSGIRHGLYAGEDGEKFTCDPDTNNAGKLFHYRITISPPTNFLSRTPTIINHDKHEFIFEGFSLFSHYPLPNLPVCKVIRFNIEYMIIYVEEPHPDNFIIRECDVFFEYLFREILELLDLDLYATEGQCPVYHFMPRFVRELPEQGRELLPMCLVLKYLLSSYKPLVPEEILPDIWNISRRKWQEFADDVKGMVVTKPGMKPSSIRVDQLDNDVEDDLKAEETRFKSDEHDLAKKLFDSIDKPVIKKENQTPYPIIIHFGVRPPQLSYAGNPEYQKAWREYVKLRHLLANLAKPKAEDKRKLTTKEAELQQMRSKSNMKRDVTAIVSSEGFYRTGLMCDVIQHAMLIPVLACHLRFHRSLNVLEKSIGYSFKNRSLLQLAMTHPSYRENFGTNPDHARNSLSNCGIRQPKYGDRRIHYMSTKKRGINTLINIMSRLGSHREKESNICHNERLEFLGDAVVEFVSTVHLFFMFRDLEEGGLATYRAALVQNQYLAVLAKNINLDSFLLYAHGSDLCHDVELKHALANCFEALMGALFLDGGISVPDKVFGDTVFGNDENLLRIWFENPQHVLQEQEPDGDRRWIEEISVLQKLTEFEEKTGIEFKHIRLLARAFTDRSVGYTNLTLGSNQRLEFLGDSVLQLIASEYLYKHFPDHHEGHLSLLRSSLVNNKTQSVVCDDLGMTSYARYAPTKTDLKMKDKADLLEAFLGAMYVDQRSLDAIQTFCEVCFFPRLTDFIMNQEWNDPKSKLQQCCLTLRTMDGGEPDIPCYKVVECKGPTNTRAYTVAVYFRGKRLANASGHSIQQAEMNAAQAAMDSCGTLFPQLDHKKRVISKTVNKYEKVWVKEGAGEGCNSKLKPSYRPPSKARHIDRKTPERYRCKRSTSRERSISSEKTFTPSSKKVKKCKSKARSSSSSSYSSSSSRSSSHSRSSRS